jgi:hypothetical protein
MNPGQDAPLALIEMGEYEGTSERFLGERTTVIRIRLTCSGTEARRILDQLRETGEVDCTITPGGALGNADMPLAKWSWFIPRR